MISELDLRVPAMINRIGIAAGGIAINRLNETMNEGIGINIVDLSGKDVLLWLFIPISITLFFVLLCSCCVVVSQTCTNLRFLKEIQSGDYHVDEKDERGGLLDKIEDLKMKSEGGVGKLLEHVTAASGSVASVTDLKDSIKSPDIKLPESGGVKEKIKDSLVSLKEGSISEVDDEYGSKVDMNNYKVGTSASNPYFRQFGSGSLKFDGDDISRRVRGEVEVEVEVEA